MNKKAIDFLFWNQNIQYEIKTREIVKDSFLSKDCSMSMVSSADPILKTMTLDKLFDIIKDKKEIFESTLSPNVVIHREEHGQLWLTPEWKIFIKKCYDLGIHNMLYDFGYFSHYQSYLVDINDSEGKSSIHIEWPTVSSDPINWNDAAAYVKSYRDKILKDIDSAKKQPPLAGLESGGYVVIWAQYALDLIRKELRDNIPTKTEVTDWCLRMCDRVRNLGLEPVVKTGPAMHAWSRFKPEEVVQQAKIFVHYPMHEHKFTGALFDPRVNSRLIAHAKFHIVNCSSVTNELVLAEAPIVATGRSWFTGLGIFNEPNSWDTILEDTTSINEKNRNKWINWCLSRQVAKQEIIPKLLEVYKKHKDTI